MRGSGRARGRRRAPAARARARGAGADNTTRSATCLALPERSAVPGSVTCPRPAMSFEAGDGRGGWAALLKGGPVYQALLGTLLTWGLTAVGAGVVFVIPVRRRD